MSWEIPFFAADENQTRPEFTAPLPTQRGALKQPAHLVKRIAAHFGNPRIPFRTQAVPLSA